jgi:hypothetical protein
MHLHEKPPILPKDLMSLGEEKTETGIKNPFLEETDPANEELASIRNERKRHKKDTSAEESEIQRLKLELNFFFFFFFALSNFFSFPN